MDAVDLQGFWTRQFGAMAPLGFRLRNTLPDRWVRVHALPSAKRYAGTPAERAEVLTRMNAVADAVLGTESACWLIAGEWELDESGFLPELPGLALGHRIVAADVEIGLGDPAAYAGGHVRWRAGAFDLLLEAVADDVRRALWASGRTGAVFAPYDGGADLIAPSTAERDALAEAFVAWRSPRPDGL